MVAQGDPAAPGSCGFEDAIAIEVAIGPLPFLRFPGRPIVAAAEGSVAETWREPEQQPVEHDELHDPERPEGGHVGRLGRQVRPPVPSRAWVAQAAARLTASVERARPANESVQNGPISASSERRPVRPQTQRRFSSNDGTVPTAVATTLAHPAASVAVATRPPSTHMLTPVEMTETVA